MKKNILFVMAIMVLIVIADQFSKYLVSKNIALNSSVPVIENVFHITFVKNQGMAFGLFQKGNLPFILFSAVFIAALVVFSKKFIERFYSKVGFSLVLAGAVGNFVDRIKHGYIIDFLDFRIWPVFNLSDAALCIGVIFLCIQYCLK
ncbi:signal peptidase II [Candidatus Desantisbacteria bacterium CG1_02_38_46]|uniref:Lipoprotein signal peptidase n=2 Tax=unclassified Candidatus Desantisiibacteriota TaxID=3106372 RepID=A0A1J4SAY6_9BACT|nr:MAG: signal peptidase II [Candidatus Desantisbacteria bacterium CG1_02_38_46]PIU50873.1 MAG: signal peptidase II [Candidatus Desantisbacteria bacterium CG07_land_8_20_14_0_80_39_15]